MPDWRFDRRRAGSVRGVLRLPVLLFLTALVQDRAIAQTDFDPQRFTVAAGLKLELFAAEPMLANPVALSIDGKGRMFIAESHRRSAGVFDITKHTDWLLRDLSFRSVADRETFLVDQFANDPTFLTRNSEVVRLVEDRDGDHRADHSEVFADGFNSPVDGTGAGILVRGTNVWFANVPNLWRLGDSDDNEIAAGRSPTGDQQSGRNSQKAEPMFTGFGVHIGVSGHDLHGLIKGPDGRIYMSFGDRGVCVTNREGVVINLPDTGGVLRCEPDGRKLEVFCSGLRNPQDLAFDDLGNLWTVDNDTAGPDRCRVLHLVEGGDYGWRCSYQHMKNFGPWISEELWKGGKDGVMPPAGVVSQGPAGLAFYPGTGFGDRFAGTFVHADFPGGVWAFTVKPQGASYVIDHKERILWNVWPTDVEFGPDGALYILDWVSGWAEPEKGRIYRMSPVAALDRTDALLVAETQRLLAEGMGRRKEMELLNLLGHQNRNVRLEAQWELASRGRDGFDGLRRVAFSSRETLPRLHAIWAVGQIARRIEINVGRDDFSDELFSMIPLLDDADPEVRLRTAELLADTALGNANLALIALLADPDPRVQAQALVSQGKTVTRIESRYALSAAEKAKSWLKDRLPNVGRQVSQYVNLDFEVSFHPGSQNVTELVRTNQSADPFFLRAAASYFKDLEIGESGWPSYRGVSGWPSAAATNETAAVRIAWVWALRSLTNSALAGFLTNDQPAVVLEAARAINDVPVPGGYPDLAGLLGREDLEREMQEAPPGPRSPGEQILRRAVNAHYRLGGATNARALVEYASRTDAPAVLRAEALFLLSQWEVKPFATDAPKIARVEGHGSSPIINPENYPQWFNRVNGLWQPLDVRTAEVARNALSPAIIGLLGGGPETIRMAAISAAVSLELDASETALVAIAGSTDEPAALRAASVRALGRIDGASLDEIVRVALADSNSTVRVAGMELIDRVDASLVLPHLDRLLKESGEIASRQAALRALGKSRSPQVVALLKHELDAAIDGAIPPELRLDAVEAGRANGNPQLMEIVTRYEDSLNPDDKLSAYRLALVGGDAGHGRELFFDHPTAQCIRCHKTGEDGGIVGPALDSAGLRLSREQLLESIVLPNNVIATGFENVAIVLKSGENRSGMVTREDDQRVWLVSPEEGEMTVGKSDIASRVRGLSAMPDGYGELLSKSDLRDLIEYLSTLKRPAE